jgi:hypothetical protein
MRIAYGKVGRSMPLSLDRCGFVGGDNECITVVKELATRHPEDTFYLVGRNSGERPEEVGLPANVVNPWIEWGPPMKAFLKSIGTSLDSIEKHIAHRDWHRVNTEPLITSMDAHVYWVGQHGSSNTPIPQVTDPTTLTKPQDAFAHYSSFIMQAVNKWRDVDPWNREEVYINADPRNYHKMRDLKWPCRHPVLTQFNFDTNLKHERYGDASPITDDWYRATRAHLEDKLWVSRLQNVYARLEPCGVFPGTPVGDLLTYDERWEDRKHFGLFINEARGYGMKPEVTRKYIMKHYVLPLQPAFVHGEWTDESLIELGVKIEGAPFKAFDGLYHSVRSTFTTPSSGSGWATTKPWEAFACGTVCFFHAKYDSQNHILKDADPELRDYLRVISPLSLARKVEEMNTDREKWLRIVRLQREHFDRAATERRYLKMIEARIWT